MNKYSFVAENPQSDIKKSEYLFSFMVSFETGVNMNCPVCNKEIGTTCNDHSHLISAKYTYIVYLGMSESHKYPITAPNLKIAFKKIFEVIGKPWKTDKRAGKSRTYRRLPHRKGYPKNMYHYKVEYHPHTILIEREPNPSYRPESWNTEN